MVLIVKIFKKIFEKSMFSVTNTALKAAGRYSAVAAWARTGKCRMKGARAYCRLEKHLLKVSKT
jgi:hypothetical protein